MLHAEKRHAVLERILSMIFLFPIFLVFITTAQVAAAAPSYEREIAPLLRTYCSGCHNDREQEGEFSVETFAALRQGGTEGGDPILPGNPADSRLIRRINSDRDDHMPPRDQPQLPPEAEALLAAWIEAGGAGPAVDSSIVASLTVPEIAPHVGIKPVTAATFSPNGSRLIVARGRSIAVLDTTGKQTSEITDFPGTVTAVHVSPDGRLLVVAGGVAGLTGVTELRDLASGAVLGSFDGHRDQLFDAELSPDGTTLATAGYDRSIKLWNVADGRLLRTIDIHNGAIFDLAWHPSGKILASASADETVKLWRASDGLRLDTLKEPQAEVYAVQFTPDGRNVIAAGRDKQIHLWSVVSLDAPASNPALQARFAHESPIVALGLSADGQHLLTAGEDRSLKSWSVPDLLLEHDHPRQPDQVSAIAASPNGGFMVGRMDGSLEPVAVVVDPRPLTPALASPASAAAAPMPAPSTLSESEPNDLPTHAQAVPLAVEIKGTVGRRGDADCFRFAGKRGEPLLLEVNAARSKSKLDSRLEVLDAAGNPVEQVILQATRDSWFTFRGKDSLESGDFRLHNWMEMELDQYLYANGEVVRLWRYPRGPDSGFLVYPGNGKRQTFFGTSAVTHALGEPAWIVEPLPPGTTPVPNGLPVFRILYENDDEATQRFGADSQLFFTPPADGEFVVRLTDVRGAGSEAKPDDYAYTLFIRQPQPSFKVDVAGENPKVSPGSGRELTFRVIRSEGFEGPIRIDVKNLPAGFVFHGPLEIEAGQQRALGVISAAADAVAPDEEADKKVAVTATATILGRDVVQDLGTLGDIQLEGPPKLTVAILRGEGAAPAPGELLELSIQPGQTLTLRVKAQRHDFAERIELGGDDSGRNLPYGLFVDNIGLNGLLIVEGQDEREFFITAAPVAKPCRRLFHLRTQAEGGQTSLPAVINVLPAAAPRR